MTLRGEVDSQINHGDKVRIALVNIIAKTEPTWNTGKHEIVFCVPHNRAKAFPIGRPVAITIEPE